MFAHPPTTAASLRELLAGDVVDAAAGLIGCRVASDRLELVIVETEAYHQDEEACHGYGGHTPRAQKLKRPPGHAYVYLSYGIHLLLNVVVGSQDFASAVLLRGAVAVPGLGGDPVPGPGRLGKTLGLSIADDGIDLLAGGTLRLTPADADDPMIGEPIAIGPRVGITKAVDLPWRFALRGSPGVSSPRP
ncbi:MAG: DNA-3-methyladenine glycosylase [Solirubrobacteraceae bacterium]|nr:DNA-3-methyladenine glycosylase [Patulibacter sp.]